MKNKKEYERLEALRQLVNLEFPNAKVKSVKYLREIIRREEKKHEKTTI